MCWQVAENRMMLRYEQHGIYRRVDRSGFTRKCYRAADEVIALTDNCLYGIFNMPDSACMAPFPPSAVRRWNRVFRQLFRRTPAHHAPVTRDVPHGEGRIVMTSSVMGLISTRVVALTRPVNMRWRRGQTRWHGATPQRN